MPWRHGVQQHVHAHALQPPLRVALQLGSERREHRRARLDQQDRRLRGDHRPVLPRQHLVGQLGDLADHLDPGRPGPDHREGQVRRPLGGVGGQLGHLEGAEDVAAQVAGVLQGLQPGRERLPFVVPEVGVRAPGRDHQAVVGQHQLPAVRGQGVHDAAVQVQALHVGQHGVRVGLLPHDPAQAGAISPPGRIPVATWYSSGWNR